MTVVDASQRLRAIDPHHSFCVGAPAGSGKTELLIQRYLGLLARVSRPEQILAITFTRKAAAEMRERVLEALNSAGEGAACDSPHQERTKALGEDALLADAREGWQLVRNISRLNIKTIDSFCSSLTRQMPVLSEFGGQAEVIDDAGELYAEAVVELFRLIGSGNALSDDLASLMLHFDNDWARLQTLLVSMLARRDQWRVYLGVHHKPEEAQDYLSHTVSTIVSAALTSLTEMLRPYLQRIFTLQQYAADNLGTAAPEHFPAAQSSELAPWRAVRGFLLTAGKKGNWRARVDVRMGFPAGAGEAKERKAEFAQLISELRKVDGLYDAVIGVATLPDTEFESNSWQLVLHLSRILPRLAAELLLVFQHRGKVDHSQVALSALQALGEDELPTELALRLDYQLEHILVDEFQDTAINQYELLRRLTRGWGEHNERNPEHPRTLLIVGDGMQSIYGFRDANVGLFLQARKEGFNGVSLDYLSLCSNFRSDAGIVQWVNTTFASAFPVTEDIGKGQIRFTEAAPVRTTGFATAVSSRGFCGEGAQALETQAICDFVRQGVDDQNCNSVAILARTRGHLQPILAKLKELNISYSAQDIDSLAQSSVIVDLLSLCRALSNPADRVSWMAILRAPWCGLSLADLHIIGTAGKVPAFTPVLELLTAAEVLEQLTSDGQIRTQHLSSAILRAQQKKDRVSLRTWIEQLWLDLGGAATASSESDLQAAERFFQLLELADYSGRGLSLSWFQVQLEKLYIQSENPSSKVQVMTLHRAKGLEFDWVVIPRLERMTRVNSKPLLLWDDYSGVDGQRGFVLAADDHSSDGDPTLYNWLKARRSQKEVLETTRLMYVGTTRAVQRLFLTACVKYDEGKDDYRDPSTRSLLASIWPAFRDQMVVSESEAGGLISTVPQGARQLHRLPLTTLQKLSGELPVGLNATDQQGSNVPQKVMNRIERHIGTVVHLALEQLSSRTELPEGVDPEDGGRWRNALAQLGLSGEDLATAFDRVEHSVCTTLADDKGRWILSRERELALSELALTTVDEQGGIVDIIIDRTFLDPENNTRWIIDYKNSQPEHEEAREAFLDRETEQYRGQLARYQMALEELWDQPIRCALYFTALAHFHPVEL